MCVCMYIDQQLDQKLATHVHVYCTQFILDDSEKRQQV